MSHSKETDMGNVEFYRDANGRKRWRGLGEPIVAQEQMEPTWQDAARKQMTHEQAYQDGRDAFFRDGAPISANPFNASNHLFTAWVSVWLDAGETMKRPRRR
jgi:hypothetical protein